MRVISSERASRIKELRKTGHSFPEIRRLLRCGYGTVIRYCQGVEVEEQYRAALREKQGGSKVRAERRWLASKQIAGSMLAPHVFNTRDKLLLLAALYWGEGTKRELNLINGDPRLIRVYMACVKSVGVDDSMFSFSLRVFGEVPVHQARLYWAKELRVAEGRIQIGEIVEGKKVGKLPFGMCRVRVRGGEKYFKLVMSMIELIASEF